MRIKDTEVIKDYLNKLDQAVLKPAEKKYLNNNITAEVLLEFEWKRFFTSYSMSFNKQHRRSGNLFHRPFKRIEITEDSYFTQAVIYIHANSLKHKLCRDFMTYKWSSWKSAVSNKTTLLCRNELIDWFGGIENFIAIHKTQAEYYYSSAIAIEDD